MRGHGLRFMDVLEASIAELELRIGRRLTREETNDLVRRCVDGAYEQSRADCERYLASTMGVRPSDMPGTADVIRRWM